MTEKLYGTTGKILRIDLSTGKAGDEILAEDTLCKYLGGTSLGTKYLYDEVDPKIEWSDPQNRIFIGSGPLGGTRIPGSGAFSMVTKGAFNNRATSTQANGFFGAYLKFSGYDGILVQGRAPGWKYLFIHDGTAELRGAQHLVGKDTWETEDAIKEELGYKGRDMSVFSIGLAGENLVKFAGVLGDRSHSASHNGIGAVWGSKKLKAIAVSRSAGGIPVAHPSTISNLAREFISDFKKSPIFEWGTSRVLPAGVTHGWLPVKNYTTNLFPEHPKFDGEYIRSHFKVKCYPCYACSSHHYNLMTVTEGPYTNYFGVEPEYEQWAAWGPQIGLTDPGAVVMLSNEADRLGLDCNEGGWVVGWVMECYEKGLLSSKELDGLEINWGNARATLSLLRNIACRKGFGDILAEGVKRAAEHVGGKATGLGVYTMQPSTPRTHDHRGRWGEMLDYCVTNTGTLESLPGFLKDWTIYGIPPSAEQFSWEQQSNAEAKTKGTLPFADSLVVCAFATRCNLPLLAEAIKAATGWNYSFDEALRSGLRTVNLMRVYNIKAGHTPELEKPSPKYCSTPTDGPTEGKSIKPHFQDMVNNYYKLMGWNQKTGLPLPETLANLGLEHIIKDLK